MNTNNKIVVKDSNKKVYNELCGYLGRVVSFNHPSGERVCGIFDNIRNDPFDKDNFEFHLNPYGWFEQDFIKDIVTTDETANSLN